MSLNINDIIKDMANSAKKSLQKEGNGVGDEVLNILEKNKDNLAELAAARSQGNIDEKDFKIEIEREKQVLEVQLLAMEIASKSAIQKAMNAAMSTLTNAVSAAI